MSRAASKKIFLGSHEPFLVYECSREPISEREPEKQKYWEIRDALIYIEFGNSTLKSDRSFDNLPLQKLTTTLTEK